VATVSQLLGIPIDYHIQINSDGMEKVVDAVGGVEIDVEKRMKYNDNWGICILICIQACKN